MNFLNTGTFVVPNGCFTRRCSRVHLELGSIVLLGRVSSRQISNEGRNVRENCRVIERIKKMVNDSLFQIRQLNGLWLNWHRWFFVVDSDATLGDFFRWRILVSCQLSGFVVWKVWFFFLNHISLIWFGFV